MQNKNVTVPVELFDVFEGERVTFQLDFQECETLNLEKGYQYDRLKGGMICPLNMNLIVEFQVEL